MNAYLGTDTVLVRTRVPIIGVVISVAAKEFLALSLAKTITPVRTLTNVSLELQDAAILASMPSEGPSVSVLPDSSWARTGKPAKVRSISPEQRMYIKTEQMMNLKGIEIIPILRHMNIYPFRNRKWRQIDLQVNHSLSGAGLIFFVRKVKINPVWYRSIKRRNLLCIFISVSFCIVSHFRHRRMRRRDHRKQL